MTTVLDEIIEASKFFSVLEFKKWFKENEGRLKSKEKNIIKGAYDRALEDVNLPKYHSSEEYYNETFKP